MSQQSQQQPVAPRTTFYCRPPSPADRQAALNITPLQVKFFVPQGSCERFAAQDGEATISHD